MRVNTSGMQHLCERLATADMHAALQAPNDATTNLSHALLQLRGLLLVGLVLRVSLRLQALALLPQRGGLRSLRGGGLVCGLELALHCRQLLLCVLARRLFHLLLAVELHLLKLVDVHLFALRAGSV